MTCRDFSIIAPFWPDPSTESNVPGAGVGGNRSWLRCWQRSLFCWRRWELSLQSPGCRHLRHCSAKARHSTKHRLNPNEPAMKPIGPKPPSSMPKSNASEPKQRCWTCTNRLALPRLSKTSMPKRCCGSHRWRSPLMQRPIAVGSIACACATGCNEFRYLCISFQTNGGESSQFSSILQTVTC